LSIITKELGLVTCK